MNDDIYFENENLHPLICKIYNDTSWFITDELVKYPNSFVWYKIGKYKYHVFKKNSDELYLTPIEGSGIRLDKIGKSTKRDKPAIKIRFITNYRILKKNKKVSRKKSTIINCIFYKPAWCGDGVINSKYGEKCDPKDPKKHNWGKKGCNIKTCQPIN